MKIIIRLFSMITLVAMVLSPGLASAGKKGGGGGGGSSCSESPIILVHGYLGSTANFATMESRLLNDGVPSCAIFKFAYNSVGDSNVTSAKRLSSFVNSALSATGQSKARLVAHSNGGLVSRWYRVFEGGSKKTSRLITLGTPHQGTSWAYGCFSPACFEMRYNSSFLNSLRGRGCDVSLWSSLDEIIIPASSAKCGTSVQTASVGHLTLLGSSAVYNDMRPFL